MTLVGRYTITGARLEDLSHLPAIERAAAALLAGHARAAVLDETTSEREFEEAQAGGRLWVALADDTPVGFALVELLAQDLPHLEEIDVHPAHGRRGLGTALLRAVCAWVSRAGYAEITLTTFRALRWNMPFYARSGRRSDSGVSVRCLGVAERARRRQQFPGLEQRLQAGQDHHPTAVELRVGALAQLVVGDGQPA